MSAFTEQNIHKGEKVAHIVKKDVHMVGYVDGKEIDALCGVRWVPFRDPENYPICTECIKKFKEAYSHMVIH